MTGLGNVTKQYRARSDGCLVRDGHFWQHTATGTDYATVSEPRIAMKRRCRINVVERPHPDIVRYDATFVEDVEVSDDNIAGDYRSLMDNVTYAECHKAKIDLYGRIDQILETKASAISNSGQRRAVATQSRLGQ